MRQRALLATALAVLLTTSACGGEPESTPDPRAPTSAPATAAVPEPVAFDPPSKFQSGGQTLAEAPRRGGALGDPQVSAVLVGRTVVYVDETALAGQDVVTGEEHWVTAMPGVTASDPTVLANPVLYENRVYAAAAITVPGSTRVTGHRAVSLAALDPTTGGVVWTATVDALPGDPVQDVRLVGITPDSIVVDTSTTTYVIDPQTRRTRWKVQLFEPTVVDGTVVAGQLGADATEVKTRTVGLRLTDGVQLWAGGVELQQGRTFPLGPGLMAASGREFTDTTPYFDFLDPATGESRYAGDRKDLRGLTDCWFDARTVVVCAGTGAGPLAVGYDASDLEEIWELPSGDRSAPRLTGAWHGAVYGELAGRPVTLDGKTGAVRNASAGAAPAVVNQYAGLSAGSGALTLFPAVG